MDSDTGDMIEQESNQGNCIHYWIIDPPNGGDSSGQCQHCGQLSMFKNHIDTGSEIGINPPSGIRFNRNRQQREMRQAEEDYRRMNRAIERDIAHDYTW